MHAAAAGAVSNTDSLARVLSSMPDNITKYNFCESIIRMQDYAHPENAILAGRTMVSVAEKLGNDSLHVSALASLYGVYYFIGDFENAIDCILKALKICDRIDSPVMRAELLMSTGVTYRSMNQFEKAFEYYNKGFEIMYKHPIESKIWRYLMNVGILYDDLKKHDSALLYISKAYVFALEGGDTVMLPKIRGNYFISLINAGMYREAENMLPEIGRALEKLDPRMRVQTLIYISKFYINKKDYTTAMQYAQDAFKLSTAINSVSMQNVALNHLSYLYEVTGNYKASLETYKKAEILNDSVLGQEHIKMIEDLNIRYETYKKNQEIENLNLQKKLDTRQKLALLIITLLTVAFAFILYKRQLAIRKRDRELFEKSEALLKTEKILAETKLQAAEREIEHQKNQLESSTRAIIEKNMLLEELKMKISQLNSTTEKATDEKLEKIKELIDSQLLTEEQWNEFRKKFEAVHRTFFVRLKELYPDITNAEMRLAALIKLKLSNREMAAMLGVSEETIYKTRYRLRKRMNLENEASIDAILLEKF